MDEPLRVVTKSELSPAETEPLRTREWLVTNGLGGYASGRVMGIITRRYHGVLIAALPAPLGRVIMLNHVREQVTLEDGTSGLLTKEEFFDDSPPRDEQYLSEFRLESGLPVWCYDINGVSFEKRLVMPYHQNTVHVIYRFVSGSGSLTFKLRPAVHFRPHETRVNTPVHGPYAITIIGDRYELSAEGFPVLRLFLHGEEKKFIIDGKKIEQIRYGIEERRGYEAKGDLWSPGYFQVSLRQGESAALTASTESWNVAFALSPYEALADECERRSLLLNSAVAHARTGTPAELVLAADQFVIAPAGRVQDEIRARAVGFQMKTVIAGYHWFTDWGRDTMISLEGLTLVTGRQNDARSILRAFIYYLRDGLIPNMFPEGEQEGLYHTADATLWFFHAIDRYLAWTNERAFLRLVLSKLLEIIDWHVRGTRFGIGVGPGDGLVREGKKGYQLTWMDAKVDEWVVTPRRGKPVEINALWYNALRLLQGWVTEEQGAEKAAPLKELAERVYRSFNERFWYREGGYLYDVVDGETGDDPACRPNQILAISLRHPVLQRDRWEAVVKVVQERLLTPVGLRSLAPGHPDYKPTYWGDLRSRDAAYHQGTVWAWLIGPFVDAWLKLYPDDRKGSRRFLEGFVPHLSEKCVGTIGEIFDADSPFYPHGCVSQAWSVAEVLRAWTRTTD
jgi:predicted glycogen debranching enzyme